VTRSQTQAMRALPVEIEGRFKLRVSSVQRGRRAEVGRDGGRRAKNGQSAQVRQRQERGEALELRRTGHEIDDQRLFVGAVLEGRVASVHESNLGKPRRRAASAEQRRRVEARCRTKVRELERAQEMEEIRRGALTLSR